MDNTFWNKKEMLSLLSMLSCFFDDNEGQPWTTLFGNRNVVFVVVTFFDDNEGQPWTTLLEIEMLSLLFVLSYFLTTTRDNLGQHFWE